MTTIAQRRQHLKWLEEITPLPTVAGREERVIEWIAAWVKARKDLTMKPDRDGNLLITQKGPKPKSPAPMFITAHMDHPGFYVREILDDRTLETEFRGGVLDPYFENAKVSIFDSDDVPHKGTIIELQTKAKPFKRAIVRLARKNSTIRPGDIGRWFFGPNGDKPVIKTGILHTPATDDLSGLAAALSALDVIRKKKGCKHVGLLLTRAEEVGFVGAIAACKHRPVPKNSRLICLENSRSFADSPIGGGPIMRVGDRMSIFDPQLTNDISRLLLEYEKKHPDYKWQRKLMAGGACEATAFCEYGYRSTCICLPLGNYHNMKDIDGVTAGKRPARVAPECISVDDYHGMVEMLVIIATQLDAGKVPPLKNRLDKLLDDHGFVLPK